jgi:parallel beta-helix repeat protein
MKNFLVFITLLTFYRFGSTTIITIDETSSTSGDYYQVIQDALNKVAENGGIVYIDNGLYSISKNLLMGSNTYLRGAGLQKTIIKLQDKAAPWWDATGKNAGMIRADFVKNVKLSDITFDGNKANQLQDMYSSYGRFGIFMEACVNVTYDKVRVQNFQGYGFDPHGYKPTMTWTDGMTITDCISHNNDWDGFTIDQSMNVIMKNNVATKNGRHGYNIVSGSKNLILDSNYAENNGFDYKGEGSGCGIAIQNNFEFGTQHITVSNNTVYFSDRAGICLNGVEDVIVSNNYVIISKACIQAISVINASLINNTCMTNATYILKPPNGVYTENNINITLPLPSRPQIAPPTPWIPTNVMSPTPWIPPSVLSPLPASTSASLNQHPTIILVIALISVFYIV